MHDLPTCNTPSPLSDEALWPCIYAFPFQGCSSLVKGMFQISEEMSRELFISVTYSLGGRWNRLFANKWFALLYSMICYTLCFDVWQTNWRALHAKHLQMKGTCNSVQLSTRLKWSVRVRNDLSTMHALICMSPKIKKASNSHLIVYFTHQA